MIFGISLFSVVVMSPFSFLILLIWILPLGHLVSLARGFLYLVDDLKEPGFGFVDFFTHQLFHNQVRQTKALFLSHFHSIVGTSYILDRLCSRLGQ